MKKITLISCFGVETLDLHFGKNHFRLREPSIIVDIDDKKQLRFLNLLI